MGLFGDFVDAVSEDFDGAKEVFDDVKKGVGNFDAMELLEEYSQVKPTDVINNSNTVQQVEGLMHMKVSDIWEETGAGDAMEQGFKKAGEDLLGLLPEPVQKDLEKYGNYLGKGAQMVGDDIAKYTDPAVQAAKETGQPFYEEYVNGVRWGREQLMDGATVVGKGIRDTVMGGAQFIGEGAIEATDWAGDTLTDGAELIGEQAGNFAGRVFNSAEALGNKVGDYAERGMDFAIDRSERVLDKAGDYAGRGTDFAIDRSERVFDKVGNLAERGVDFVTDRSERAFDKVGNLAERGVDFITDRGERTLDKLGAGAEWAGDRFDDAKEAVLDMEAVKQLQEYAPMSINDAIERSQTIRLMKDLMEMDVDEILESTGIPDSPDKVAIWAGKKIVRGAEIGITESADTFMGAGEAIVKGFGKTGERLGGYMERRTEDYGQRLGDYLAKQSESIGESISEGFISPILDNGLEAYSWTADQVTSGINTVDGQVIGGVQWLGDNIIDPVGNTMQDELELQQTAAEIASDVQKKNHEIMNNIIGNLGF